MSELEASVSCSPQCAETDSNKNTGDINPETVQNTISNNSQVEEALQSDGDPLKDLLTDKFCHVCEATLLYDSQRVSHYEGKKHAQRVRLYLQNMISERKAQSQEGKTSLGGPSTNPDKFCELCNMVFSSPTVAKSHYDGKVHAKNMKRANAPPHGTSTPAVASTPPPVRPAEVAVPKQTGPEQMETSGLGAQEVNTDDPNKYCALCKATFNNPVVAQQHYSGRKHQRNQTRQQMFDELGDQSEQVSALTCPICCLTFSSIEMYQAHMQGSKHQVKEKKVKELCQSQKKVYDSYQDELADYIQVQKARGLEPKAGSGAVGQTSKSLNETINESPQAGDAMPHPAPMPQRPPPAGFTRPPWHPYQVDNFGFRMRGPVPPYLPEYMPHPRAPFMPGKRRWSPDSYSSSSSSDSSSSYTSSSSSSSDSSYESRRKRKQKMRMQRRKRRLQEGESEMDRREGEEDKQEEKKRKQKGDRKGSVEREDRKWKARRRKERSSSEDEQSRSKRRQRKKSRRHGDHAKRRKEEGLMVKGEEEVMNDEAQGEMNENVDERTDMKDGKQKHKKDKKVKEKVNQEDNRTEEERLWDETILGVF